MNKNRIILTVLSLIIVLGFSSFIYAQNDENELKSKFSNFGTISKKYMDLDSKDNTIAFTINGEEITINKINEKKELEQALGKTNIKDSEVVKSIIKNKTLLQQAKKLGVTVSDEEAKNASLHEKELLYDNHTSNEDREAVLEYIKSLGISEDEYWNVYNVKQYKDFLAVNKLYEIVTKDAVIMKSDAINSSETLEIKKQYFAKYTEDLYNNAIIEYINADLKLKIDKNE